jgi:ATP-dependent RNA helicase RhlE
MYNAAIIDNELNTMTIFAELGLNSTIQENVAKLGYSSPTDIQAKSIGAILSGSDTYGIAATGTGKTAAYLLPLLQELTQVDHTADQVRPIRALFLVPTRELAQQVEQSIMQYGKGLKLRTITLFGGVRIESQAKRFKRGSDIIVATPKRLLDLLRVKAFSLEQVQYFVMDEADRLVSMGIQAILDKVMKTMPQKKQTILFSATDSKALAQFSLEHLKNQKIVKAEASQPTLEKIIHTMYRCHRGEKNQTLLALLEMLNCERALIFIRTKNDVDVLTALLNEKGFPSQGIHNEIKQKHRQERLLGFKNKEFKFLVATDIAARGIDIDDLYYVINFDLPVNSNDYIHRAGRTARKGASKQTAAIEASRKIENKKVIPDAPWIKQKNTAGALGHVLSLVSPEQERLVEKVIKSVGKDIKLERNPFMKKS